MRETFLAAFKLIIADRLMSGLLLLLIVMATIYCIYVGVSLHPGDLQVAVHYTAYGQTNYYRNQWYYLISFILFGGVIAICHSLIAMKLYVLQRRGLAIGFLIFSYFLLAIAWVITHSVLGIAIL